MQRLRALLVLMFSACFAGGCVLVEDDLTINADGSGVVQLKVESFMSIGALDLLRDDAPAELAYPPLSAGDLQRLFPVDNFRITEINVMRGAAGVTFSARIQFTDVNHLLNSPYGKAHGLSLAINEADKTLELRAGTGLESLAAIDEMTGDSLPFDVDEVKASIEKMSMRFRITLPGPVKAEGVAAEGNTLTWEIRRAGMEPQAFAEALHTVVKATCPAGAITFEPRGPRRLDLVDFADVAEGPISDNDEPQIDVERIRREAKIEPVLVSITQTFDLTGEGFFYDDGAHLLALATLPADLAPQRWSEHTISSITDDNGNDLSPNEERHFYNHPRYGSGSPNTRIFRIRFNQPNREARAVNVVGSIRAQYPGTGRVIRIAEAVKPSQLAADPQKQFEVESEPLTNRELDAVSAKMKVHGTMQAQGITLITLSFQSETAGVAQVVVFDAAGHPWRTLSQFHPSDYGGMVRVFVPGEPQAPLSIAVEVTGDASVVLPFTFNNLSLKPNEPPVPADETEQTTEGVGADLEATAEEIGDAVENAAE